MILQQDKEWLAHYGVKGMKWGVRRSDDEIARDRARKSSDKKVKKERKAASKSRRISSDSDIDSLISRLEKEKKLKNLVKADTGPGKKVAEEILGSIGTKTAKTLGGAAAVALGAVSVGVLFDYGLGMFGKSSAEVRKNFKIPKPK